MPRPSPYKEILSPPALPIPLPVSEQVINGYYNNIHCHVAGDSLQVGQPHLLGCGGTGTGPRTV